MEIRTIKDQMVEQANKYPDKPAFKMREGDGYRSVTYGQVAETAARLQAEFVRRGVAVGDRIALISENRPEWPITYFAITSMGAVAVPLDAMLRREEILPLLEDSEPKLIVCTSKYLEYVKGTALENKALLMEDFGKLPAAEKLVDNQITPATLAVIVYTSGTTGIPKGVMLSHGNIIFDAQQTLKVIKFFPTDVWLSVLPLHHTFESLACLFGSFCSGNTIVYAESLKSHSLLANMRDNGITVMCGVPLLYQLFYEGILREVEEKKLTPVFKVLFFISGLFNALGIKIGRALFGTVHKKFGGKIRMFVVGGAAMDVEVLKKFDLMGFPIVQGYGMTEATPIIACNSLADNHLGSAGKAIPGVQVKIDEKTGEILAKGPNIMLGYYKRQSMTDEVVIDGWLHTGDVGRLDKDGSLYITGRCKDVIVTGSGVNIYPEEIEHWLNRLVPVKESCVLGVKVQEGFRKGSEEVGAVVVPKEGYGEPEVKAAIQELNKQLAEYKRIARIFFRKEELPKTRLQKVKRFAVKKEMGL